MRDTEGRILLLDLEARKVDEEDAKTITDIVGVRLQKAPDLDVVTTNDVRKLLELEAQRATIGCVEGAESCIAEAADAIGARFSFFGEVGKLGSVFVVTLSIMDAQRASILRPRAHPSAAHGRDAKARRGSGRQAARERAAFNRRVSRSALVLDERRPPPEPNVVSAEDDLTLPLAVVGAGAAATVVGAVSTVVGLLPVMAANSVAGQLQASDLDDAQRNALRAARARGHRGRERTAVDHADDAGRCPRRRWTGERHRRQHVGGGVETKKKRPSSRGAFFRLACADQSNASSASSGMPVRAMSSSRSLVDGRPSLAAS